MKKFLIAGLTILSFATGAFASDNTSISNKAMAHLEANYSTAQNISWTVTNNFEKASITVGNEKMDVYYNVNGDLLGSTKTMAFDKLPKAALDIFTTEYTFPNYQLTDCIEFTDADNNKSFYVSFDIDNERIVIAISTNGSVTQI